MSFTLCSVSKGIHLAAHSPLHYLIAAELRLSPDSVDNPSSRLTVKSIVVVSIRRLPPHRFRRLFHGFRSTCERIKKIWSWGNFVTEEKGRCRCFKDLVKAMQIFASFEQLMKIFESFQKLMKSFKVASQGKHSSNPVDLELLPAAVLVFIFVCSNIDFFCAFLKQS